MKVFKKRLTPLNPRGASPSFSSTSSASSSYAQPFGQHQKQHEFRTSGKLDRSNLSPKDHSSKDPEIIIRALKPYNAQRATELSVKAGDFLQVIGEAWPSDGSGWFEAIDTFSGVRGFVPMHLFQVFSSGGYHPTRPSKQYSVAPKTEPELSVSRNPKPSSTYQHARPSLPSQHPAKSSPTNQPLMTRQPLYGVARYDFVPQRNDELQTEKDEAIVLIAHSHHDWFLAKPIGRLGGPGLIPVNYVEVKDLATGKGLGPQAVRKLMDDNILPGIEEWKQATAAYRCNSIPLGRFENPAATTTASKNVSSTLRRGMAKSHQQLGTKPPEADQPVARPSRKHIAQPLNQYTQVEEVQPVDIPIPSSRSVEDIMISSDPTQSTELVNHWPKFSNNGDSTRETSKNETADCGRVNSASGEDGYATVEDLRQRYGVLTYASVESFHKEQDEFWFHLRSHFSSPSSTNPTGEETTVLVLYRVYEDFFDFHAELLNTFPEEAGRQNYDRPSIFPKLPEPKDTVNEIVCAERVNTLSIYLEELSKLPSYIRDCEIFYEFLGPREGDVELQESAPSTGSRESADKALMDEIEQLSQSNPSSSKKLSTQKSGHSSDKHTTESSEPHFQKNAPQASTQAQNQGRKTHQSNFSSSSTASFVESVTTPVNTSHFPEANQISPPKSYYRIKVFQENSLDVIAIKATNTMTRAELLQKVSERVCSLAQAPGDKKIGKLFIKDDTKDPKTWKELQNDEQMCQWLAEYQSRLALLYSPPDLK